MRILLSIVSCIVWLAYLMPIQADFDPSSANGNNYTEKPYEKWDEGKSGPDTIDRGDIFKKQTDDNGMRDKFLNFLKIDLWFKDLGAVGWIKSLLNIMLALAGFIALCFMIYGFVRIFFAAGEEAVKNAWTIVKISSIALAIIAAARFLESFFFYVFEQISEKL